MLKYSFIIPVKAINDYVREAIPKILAINREDYEIIVYPDEPSTDVWPKTRNIASVLPGPAVKRNLAIRDALGEILIFVDDDAYPNPDFLDILDTDFADTDVKAVGGPALTPEQDSFWQKVSGAVFLSNLSGGNPERYVPIGEKKKIDDWPTVNFSIRKEIFKELNGFDSQYWPGEDTKLCLDLIKKYPSSIIYDPKLIVYHHRRVGLTKHLKQVGGYGLHRGFFAKKYPATSLRLKYFPPTLFFLFVIFGGILGYFFTLIFRVYLFGWLIYLLALCKAFVDIRRWEKNPLVAISALHYIVLTHLVYGWNFIRGLLTKELKSKLR